jgi:sulfur carrier protein ThiS
MATILFNAFSFLQKKLKKRNQPYANVSMDIEEGTTVANILKTVGIEKKDLEAAFVNGKVVPFNTVLKNGDRVALIPPGTPGPYRVMLAMVQQKNSK